MWRNLTHFHGTVGKKWFQNMNISKLILRFGFHGFRLLPKFVA
jgi:hypothetical protein